MSNRTILILLLIVAGAAMRFIPLPPNVAPIAAMALFGAAYFRSNLMAFGVPLAALFVSDLVFQFFVPGFGFHATMPFVYAAFLLIGGIGYWLRDRLSVMNVLGGSLAGSLLFFVLSNLGVWLTSPMYMLNWQGLVQCFTMAIPFFKYSVGGDLFFNAVFFGSAYLVFYSFPSFARS